MRKRFTISDSQFSVDTNLESEGKSDLEEAKKILQDNAPFWQALGGR